MRRALAAVRITSLILMAALLLFGSSRPAAAGGGEDPNGKAGKKLEDSVKGDPSGETEAEKKGLYGIARELFSWFLWALSAVILVVALPVAILQGAFGGSDRGAAAKRNVKLIILAYLTVTLFSIFGNGFLWLLTGKMDIARGVVPLLPPWL